MGAFADYIAAARDSGNPEQFVREYISPAEAASQAGRAALPQQQTHNAAPVNSNLKNWSAPKAKVDTSSNYYQAGAQARTTWGGDRKSNGTYRGPQGGGKNTTNGGSERSWWTAKPWWDAKSADEEDAEHMKDEAWYRSKAEEILGHPVNALSFEQVKDIVERNTGDYSPYVDTGSNNPYYTPLMAELDAAAQMNSGDIKHYGENESHDTSAYWDAHRPEVHNVAPIPAKSTDKPSDVLRAGYNALFNYDGNPTMVAPAETSEPRVPDAVRFAQQRGETTAEELERMGRRLYPTFGKTYAGGNVMVTDSGTSNSQPKTKDYDPYAGYITDPVTAANFEDAYKSSLANADNTPTTPKDEAFRQDAGAAANGAYSNSYRDLPQNSQKTADPMYSQFQKDYDRMKARFPNYSNTALVDLILFSEMQNSGYETPYYKWIEENLR